MDVNVEVSVVNARAASGLRSRSNRFNNSAEKCCASAAEPPFPHVIILCFATKDLDISLIALVRGSSNAAWDSCLVRMLFIKWDVILASRLI